MRHISRFSELFENKSGLTKRQTEFLDRYTKGKWRVNPTTGLVDVDGDFDCSEKGLTDFGGIRFGKVSGNFFCSFNSLTSLDGSPEEVSYGFYCNGNKLTSLKGSPKRVGGDFFCQDNRLTSLEGAPSSEVSGNFYCYINDLTSLKGSPRKVGGNFYCNNNKLTTLKGSPKEVDGNFICFDNKLTSLEGAPEKVGENFYLNPEDEFKWTLRGKFEYLNIHPEDANFLFTNMTYREIKNETIKDPSLLSVIEKFDSELHDKVLKGLGWDKMGSDLLRQLKDGIF
jgi:hypothetical protein